MKQVGLIVLFLFALMNFGCSPSDPEATEKGPSITVAQAHEISQDGFLFGVPLVYIALSAEVGSNVPEPQGLRAPINQFAHYRT